MTRCAERMSFLIFRLFQGTPTGTPTTVMSLHKTIHEGGGAFLQVHRMVAHHIHLPRVFRQKLLQLLQRPLCLQPPLQLELLLGQSLAGVVFGGRRGSDVHVGLPEVMVDVVAFQTHQQEHQADLDAWRGRGEEHNPRQRDGHTQCEKGGGFGGE